MSGNGPKVTIAARTKKIKKLEAEIAYLDDQRCELKNTIIDLDAKISAMHDKLYAEQLAIRAERLKAIT